MSKSTLPSSNTDFKINICLLFHRPQIAIYRIGTDINVILERAIAQTAEESLQITLIDRTSGIADILHKSYCIWGTLEKTLLAK